MSTAKTGALRAGRPSESRKATTLASLADKGPTVRINFDLERDQHRRLKMFAVQQDRSVADILREMVEKLLVNEPSLKHTIECERAPVTE